MYTGLSNSTAFLNTAQEFAPDALGSERPTCRGDLAFTQWLLRTCGPTSGTLQSVSLQCPDMPGVSFVICVVAPVRLKHTRSTPREYHTTRIPNCKGGRGPYKLTMSLKFTTYLQCLKTMQSLQYEDAKKQGRTLALHTYSALKMCKVYNTKITN